MDVVHLHPLELDLTSKASLGSLSPLELALVSLHTDVDPSITHHARRLWHQRRLKAAQHELDSFSSARATATPSGTSGSTSGGSRQHQHQSRHPQRAPPDPAPTLSQRYRPPLEQRSVPAVYAELVAILLAESRKANRKPLAKEISQEWVRRTGSDRQAFRKHVEQAAAAGVVQKWRDPKTGDDWLELASESTPPPSPPPSQASPPALPVLTSTNFHLADLDFPLPSSLDILSSVQLLCLQFRDDFSPTKIWDETAGLTGQEEIEGIWLRRATRDQRKGLRWTEVAAASTSSNDSRRSSAATRGVESRYGSVDHPPPTPDSPPLSLHHSDTTTELRLSSHLRRRSSRSRSPPPRKARPDIDRPSHAALSSSRRHSSEEVDGTSAAHGSRLPDVQRNMSPSAALALPEGDVGHVPRSLSDSFHTIKITMTIRRVARDEVLGWLPKRLSPGLIDVKGAQGWLAWKSESEAADALAHLNEQWGERVGLRAIWARGRDWPWLSIVDPSLRLELSKQAMGRERVDAAPSKNSSRTDSPRRSLQTETDKIGQKESRTDVREVTSGLLPSERGRAEPEPSTERRKPQDRRRSRSPVSRTSPPTSSSPPLDHVQPPPSHSSRRHHHEHRHEHAEPSPSVELRKSRREDRERPHKRRRRDSRSRSPESVGHRASHHAFKHGGDRHQPSAPPRSSSTSTALDPRLPVPHELIETLPQLRIAFASLPRDLTSRESLHALFVARFNAVGWQNEDPRQRTNSFRILFHGRRDLDSATEWFRGPARTYWSSNRLEAQVVHPNAAQKVWEWRDMSKRERESYGVTIEQVDLQRKRAEDQEESGWAEFGWELKRKGLGRNAEYDDSRWARSSSSATPAVVHPARRDEGGFWSGPSAASRASWIADKSFKKHVDVDQPEQDTTTTSILDYYGSHREDEVQARPSEVEEGEVVESAPPPHGDDALTAAFAHSPSPLTLNHEQDLADYDQSLVDFETTEKDKQATLLPDPLPSAVASTSTQAPLPPTSIVPSSEATLLDPHPSPARAVDDQKADAEEPPTAEAEAELETAVIGEVGEEMKVFDVGEKAVESEGAEKGAREEREEEAEEIGEAD